MKTRWMLLALVAALPLAARAHVQASLVAAENSIRPGQPFTVALRMEHEPHWHSYWLNAGTGYPTKLTWELPPGWAAGEIRWPTPILIKDSQGNVTGHGYDGVLYLPVTITPPADAKVGERIALRAAASWLMCADICIPGKADVALTLPLSADAPQANAPVQSALAQQSMPKAPEGWQLSASKDAGTVTLQARAPQEITDPHFFSVSEFIQYDQPPRVAGEA